MNDVWQDFYCSTKSQEPLQYRYWVICWTKGGDIEWCRYVTRDEAKNFIAKNKCVKYKRFDVEPQLRG